MEESITQSAESAGFVSVIVPNYNHGAFLEQRIQSVLNQTYTSFEIILLDDCSTDNSRDIMARFHGHPKVSHVIFNESNSGSPFMQWEKGIALAKGDFIWIAESDDWCEDTLLARLIEPMNDNSVTVSYCQSHCLDTEGKIKWTSAHPQLEETVDGKPFINKYMLQMNGIFNASMALWRRDCYSTMKHDYREYRFCGDWIFWIRMALLGKVAISGRVLNYFRKHGNDVSGNVYKSGYNFKEELRLLNTLKAEGIIDEKQLVSALKAKFKQFWRRREQYNKSDAHEIQGLFNRLFPSKSQAFKIRASALWQSLKGK